MKDDERTPYTLNLTRGEVIMVTAVLIGFIDNEGDEYPEMAKSVDRAVSELRSQYDAFRVLSKIDMIARHRE